MSRVLSVDDVQDILHFHPTGRKRSENTSTLAEYLEVLNYLKGLSLADFNYGERETGLEKSLTTSDRGGIYWIHFPSGHRLVLTDVVQVPYLSEVKDLGKWHCELSADLEVGGGIWCGAERSTPEEALELFKKEVNKALTSVQVLGKISLRLI